MHACGHDFHMAISVLTIMKIRMSNLSGVRVIFQPSEEGPESGAKFLISKGVLRGIKGVFALHLDPGIGLGRIGIRSGPFMAAANHFKIFISGRSSHAALPHLGQDTIVAASRLIIDIQAIISRKKSPVDAGLITVGKISGGERFNILAKETVLEGTIRALAPETLKELKQEIKRLGLGLESDYRVGVDFRFSSDFPPVVNDSKMVEMVINSAIPLLGRDAICGISPTLGSEDFSYYQKKSPGVMFMLGCRDERSGSVYPLHHDRFRAPDDVIEIGSEILFQCCRYFLS